MLDSEPSLGGQVISVKQKDLTLQKSGNWFVCLVVVGSRRILLSKSLLWLLSLAEADRASGDQKSLQMGILWPSIRLWFCHGSHESHEFELAAWNLTNGWGNISNSAGSFSPFQKTMSRRWQFQSVEASLSRELALVGVPIPKARSWAGRWEHWECHQDPKGMGNTGAKASMSWPTGQNTAIV